MNKKLIAAAIAASIAAPMAANADVTVYGRAQLEMANIEVGSTDSTTLTDYKNSRLGVKWSEDLGGGLSAVGEMEFGPAFLDAATSASAFKDATGVAQSVGAAGLYARQANLGLKGSFGEVRFGTNLQPYKYAGGVKYDAFVATTAEARGNGGAMIKTHFGQGGYFANSISYKNTFGNVTVHLATSLDEASDAGNSYVGRDGDIMAAVTVGLGKGAEVGVAMASDDIGGGLTVGAAGEENTKIFGKYTMGAHKIVAQFEQQDVVNNNNDTDFIFLGYTMTMGANQFVVQLGQADKSVGNDTDYMALGAFHNFSKKTRVFVAYHETDIDGGSTSDITSFSLGMDTKF